MAEEDGGFIWPDEDGADEDFTVIHHILVQCGRVSVDATGRRERGRAINVKGKF